MTLSFALDNKIAGPSEKFAHLTNIVLHCVCVMLIFFFLRKYMFDDAVSFCAGLLFAVHPAAIQTVAWVAGRNDSLFLIFFLAAFIFFIEYLKSGKIHFIAAHMIFMCLGFFVKESGIAMPFIFASYYFTHKDESKIKLNPAVYVIWLATMAGFLFLRSSIMGAQFLPLSNLHFTMKNTSYFFDYYASVIFLRAPMAANQSALTFFLGIIAFAAAAFMSFCGKKDKQSIYKSAFYFILPLIFLAPNFINDRLFFQGNRIYIPLFAIIITAASFCKTVAEGKERVKNIIILCFAAVFLTASAVTIVKTDYFQNPIKFWKAIIDENKFFDSTPYKFYIRALYERGHVQEAIDKAIFVLNNAGMEPEIMYTLMHSFVLNGDFENAAKTGERLIESRFSHPTIYADLAISYYFLNNDEKMELYSQMLRKATGYTPEQINDYMNSYLNNIRTIARTSFIKRAHNKN
jgi:hypothetical protein